MKILHLCLACFYIDNYSYQENMLPKYHKLMGYDVSVIASLLSFDKNGNYCLLESSGSYISSDNYKVTRLNYRNSFRLVNKNLRIYEKFYNSIETENPDIIFIHGCQFWDIRQVVKYTKCHHNVKIFVDNHADFINSATNWISRNIFHRIIWRYCAKSIEPYTQKFFGVNPLRCEFLKIVYKIPGDRIELLVLGADDERIKLNQKDLIIRSIRKENNISETDFVIVTGGKIDERKNIHLLMQAVNELGKDNITLIIFGTTNQFMKPILENLKKSNHIKYIGWIDSNKIYDYFLASDLAVFPGTHSVLWEQSVGSGIPGVFKFWQGMDHLDLGGNCKFLYNDRVDEIKKVLEEIIDDKDMYLEMKKISAEMGIKNFSYKEIAKKAIHY